MTKDVLKKVYQYIIKTMNGMAYGLFSTLIIGTIISTFANLLNSNNLLTLADLLKTLTGVGIGIGIAWALKLDGLKLIGAAIAGGIASGLVFGKPGDPVVIYLTVVLAVELVRLFFTKKTPLDIILIPLMYAIISYYFSLLINPPVSTMMKSIGDFITWATERQPFIMGIIIAVVMGMILTAPISSAAIAISINLTGLAGGAAVVGCCTQMLGFAVMSRKDNSIGEVISIGIGTSMLQFKNILKKPIIWLPTIIVSAILGPLSTILFKTQTDSTGAGMGTSGLVGQFGTFNLMGNTKEFWLSVLVLQIALPIILVWIVDIVFRKKGLIKKGDLAIKEQGEN